MSGDPVRHRDIPDYLLGGGCVLSIPFVLAFSFYSALRYAKKKEHVFAHQVEEVELEGAAAELTGPVKDSLEKFVKRLERMVETFDKMDGRFSPDDFQAHIAHLDVLRNRVAEEAPSDSECQNLIGRATQCLKRYAPSF